MILREQIQARRRPPRCLHKWAAVSAVGGESKGADLGRWAEVVKAHCYHVFVYGKDRDRFAAILGPHATVVETLDRAFECAVADASQGDVVLLSPPARASTNFLATKNVVITSGILWRQIVKPKIRRSDFMPLGVPDIHFILAACALACLGFLLVASSSVEVASDRFGQPFSFAMKHAFFLPNCIDRRRDRIFDTDTIVVPLCNTFFTSLDGASRNYFDTGRRPYSEGCDTLAQSRDIQSSTI